MKNKIILSYLGLIPFIFFTSTPIISNILTIDEAAIFLIAYGAIVISFLGGMAWAWSIKNNFSLLLGVSFSLIGFFLLCLSLIALKLSLLINIFIFPAYFLFEKSLNPLMREAIYYNLRRNLTIIVSACFVISFISLNQIT